MANNASYWPLDYPPLSGYQVRKCTLSLDSTACIMRTQQAIFVSQATAQCVVLGNPSALA